VRADLAAMGLAEFAAYLTSGPTRVVKGGVFAQEAWASLREDP
jgi:hypothetical protein